jgi:predicted Rossmann-fold nucleotide-binding protein
MNHSFFSDHYDLITPDGVITRIEKINNQQYRAWIEFSNISLNFIGFQLEQHFIEFNLKSTLAQLGLDAHYTHLELDAARGLAFCCLEIQAHGKIAEDLIALLTPNIAIGKLFAADPRRRVRDPEYLRRMFGRSDHQGRPLLSLGGLQGSNDLILEKIDGRSIAYLSLRPGIVQYQPSIQGLLPTIIKALEKGFSLRHLLQLHQYMNAEGIQQVKPEQILLVRTLPLHVRTTFARVVDELLPPGYRHTNARILDPSTAASGDIYELYGSSEVEISDIPLEFYTLEPHREHIFFKDRDQLQNFLEKPELVFEAFKTAPSLQTEKAAVFIVKGTQLKNLIPQDWISCQLHTPQFPGIWHGARQALMVDRFIEQQAEYPYLEAIETGKITSQGVLLTKFFPSPLMKRLILNGRILQCLKGIYFQKPSQLRGDFFSHEDHNFLADLWKFALPIFWVDQQTNSLLQYVQKNENNAGIFTPLSKTTTYLKASVFGVYGSNLLEGNFENELNLLMQGLLNLKETTIHPLLNKQTPLALVTGGGPGAMEVGNRVAKNLDILSCAHIVDFSRKDQIINEQHQNLHVEAKMTYRIDKLVERQADFNLDFPIFVMGGMGTDFEFHLEQVRRKTGAVSPRPILLFGSTDYWEDKITSTFQRNLKSGTIRGSEWISRSYFCIQTAEQALEVYRAYFNQELIISAQSLPNARGFVVVGEPEWLTGKSS